MLSSSKLAAPAGFFAFRWDLCPPDGQVRHLAVAFKVAGTFPEGSVVELTESLCRGPITPDGVIIVSLKNDSEDIQADFTLPSSSAALARYHGRLPLVHITADLLDPSVIARYVRPIMGVADAMILEFARLRFDELVQAGLASIFSADVLVEAPPGFDFLKPSGSSSSYFLRAELGLDSSAAVAFTAYAAWRKIKFSGRGKNYEIRQIFVDTMAISPVAFFLRELSILSGQSSPAVESFHSYGGFEKVPLLLASDSVCLISASTSMNLHREWCREKGVRSDEVITLVTFADCVDSDAALFCLPASLRPARQLTSQQHIRITGENFATADQPTQRVLLRKKGHGWQAGVERLFEDALLGKGVFDLYRAASASGKRRGLFVNGRRLLETSSFDRFINERVVPRIPAITTGILYENDAASEELAISLFSCCIACGLKPPTLICFDELESGTATFDSHDGLVIASCVSGSGSSLLNVSRNLRGIHNGPRLYVVGMIVGLTNAATEVLRRNLESSSSGASIAVECFGQLAVGHAIEESFESERALYSSLTQTNLPLLIRERDLLLRRTLEPRSGGALWGVDFATAPLTLRKDFVFWPPGYSEGPYHAEVVGSIAVLLQRARELPTSDLTHSLKAGAHHRVVLDPENFARFDDAIIQAALLRSAQKNELDYRSDMGSSEYCSTYLQRIARQLGTARAECAIEFLVALATRRMQLHPRHLADVVTKFDAACSEQCTELAEAVRWFLPKIAKSSSSLPSSDERLL